MSSTTWAEAVLVVTVFAPVAAVVFAVALALPDEERRVPVTGCVVAAVGACLLLLAGQHPSVARLAPDDLGLAAIVGVALLAISRPADERTPLVAAMVTVASAGVSAGMPARPSTIGPVLGIAGVLVLAALARELHPIGVGVAAVGVVAAAVGVHNGGRGGAAVVVLSAAVLAVLGSVPRRAIGVIAPLALVLALRVAPELAGQSAARATAVVLGIAAVIAATASVTSSRWTVQARCAALAPWALVAAIEPVPGTGGAARALVAAAVLALLLGGPLASLAALPGGAVLVYAIADGDGWVRATLALLLALTLAGLLRPDVSPTGRRIRAVDGVGAALGGWLVVRPSAWTWMHISDVTAYEEGTAIAVAVALLLGVVLAGQGAALDRAAVPPWLVVDDTEAVPSGAARLPTVVGIATGIVVALLLRSARL
jgi:hypothetical protein